MKLQDIETVRQNEFERDQFIQQHTNFILSCASKATGRYIDKSDDEFSIAMIAFDEAINKFDTDKGNFLSFAGLIIKSRLIDNMRKADNKTVPFSSLSHTNNKGDIEEFDVVGESDAVTDTALEFQALKDELSNYEISFFDIPKDSPKSKKTKQVVFTILKTIKNDEFLKETVLKNKILPVKTLIDRTGANKKIFERHRKYIIAATVILCGEYPTIATYIKGLEEVSK